MLNDSPRGCDVNDRDVHCSTSQNVSYLSDVHLSMSDSSEAESSVSVSEMSPVPRKVTNLNKDLMYVLPDSDEYTYIVESFNKLPVHTFCGAPTVNFDAYIRVNLNDDREVSRWIEAFSEKSKCTYRTTRTYKPLMKKVSFKVDMHCQHFKKKLSAKQVLIKKRVKTRTMLSGVKCKKTQCPSSLKVTIQIPRKQKVRKYRKYCGTHKAHIQLSFHHNHPIESAHVLGYRPVAESTKDTYTELFSCGHSASSAHHQYEEKVLKESGQSSMADSAINPGIHWVHRFYREWRSQTFGAENGKDLFQQLEQEVLAYNQCNNQFGGKVLMQEYAAPIVESSDDESDQESNVKQSKTTKHSVPLIISICTPLMSCVHRHAQQSRELIFCDSTSSLDRFNVSLFVLSTAHPAGGLPLGVLITSDEKETTIKNELEKLIQTLPSHAFYGNGPKEGPTLVMTDDSSAEKQALKSVWANSKQLLCLFHFLQRRWTWLFEGKNRIQQKDRATLLNLVKTLVFAKSELMLQMEYEEFLSNSTVIKYPNFMKHVQSLWSRRSEWALCYRCHLPVRGNNTNNLSEAGVRILKEIVFGRVKAYNLVEMFQFVVDKLEHYYQRRILSIAHCRFDRYIQVRFRGLNCGKIQKENIKPNPEDND